MSKRILSFDVGIKNLAYCLLEKIESSNEFNIISWGVINLVDDRQKCMFALRGGKQCEQNAKCMIYHKENSDIFKDKTLIYYACAKHKIKIMPVIIEKEGEKCMMCEQKSNYELSTNSEFCWCNIHYQKNGKAFEKKINTKKLSVISCNKQPIQNLAEKLYMKLDNEPLFLTAEEILIENQPSLRNPTMKTIASILYSYFVLRGIIDKKNTKSNINYVKFICPSNKLKIDKINTDIILENKNNNKEKSEIYKLTKSLGIKYCIALINDKYKDILNKYKKKDDMADSFLQGFQYLFNPVPQKYMSKLTSIDNKKEDNKKEDNKENKKEDNKEIEIKKKKK